MYSSILVGGLCVQFSLSQYFPRRHFELITPRLGKAARFCCNNYQPTASVAAMIQDLGWKTLESRRTMTRLTFLYKMSRGEIDIDTDSFLRPHAESRTRATHSYRYRQDKATKNLYFYSFFPRTLRQWNNLPADIVESNSLSQFQSKLSDHLSHV